MLTAFLNTAKKNKYKIFERPYELNIWGVRANSIIPNKFDDTIICFWKDNKGNWQQEQFKASTDPSTYWLKNPMVGTGAAILSQGQNLNAWYLGNSYLGGTLPVYCLIQSKPVQYIRDYNRDAILDFANGTLETGNIGIWIHQGSNAGGKSLEVGLWSAGCQVIADWKDWTRFIQLCEIHKRYYGNSFSYTLIDQRAINRARWRYATSVAGVLAVATGLYFGIREIKKL
jgi:hypothetical protein